MRRLSLRRVGPRRRIVRIRASSSEKRKRLDQIIVSSEIQLLHPIGNRIAGREKENGGFLTRSAQAGDNGPSIQLREHDIENE